MSQCVVVVVVQVKYDLTRSFTGEDDKETIHCEFDVTDSGMEWTSGLELCLYLLYYC